MNFGAPEPIQVPHPDAPVRRRPLALVETAAVCPEDFSNVESGRVLTAAALAVAAELGREAARRSFAELVNSQANQE